jgi:hypothetical protein
MANPDSQKAILASVVVQQHKVSWIQTWLGPTLHLGIKHPLFAIVQMVAIPLQMVLTF